MRTIHTMARATLAVLATALLALGMLTALQPSASADTTEVDTPARTMLPDTQARTTAARGGCRVPRCYGALSINPVAGSSGYANDYGTKRAAVRAAYRACRNASPDGYAGYCRKIVWVRNGCAAVAYRQRDGVLREYASAVAYNLKPAKRKALRKVRGNGREKIWTYVCTTRR